MNHKFSVASIIMMSFLLANVLVAFPVTNNAGATNNDELTFNTDCDNDVLVQTRVFDEQLAVCEVRETKVKKVRPLCAVPRNKATFDLYSLAKEPVKAKQKYAICLIPGDVVAEEVRLAITFDNKIRIHGTTYSRIQKHSHLTDITKTSRSYETTDSENCNSALFSTSPSSGRLHFYKTIQIPDGLVADLERIEWKRCGPNHLWQIRIPLE